MTCFPVNRRRRTAHRPRALGFGLLLAIPVFVLAPYPAHAGQPRSSASLAGAEAQFKLVLENIQQERLAAALSEVDRLIVRYPNFRLAHLVRGDLLLARAKPIARGDLSVFRNPGKQDLMVVTFDQDYRSNNLSQKVRKRQFWVMADGRWKIAYEAPAGVVKLALPESFPKGSG